MSSGYTDAEINKAIDNLFNYSEKILNYGNPITTSSLNPIVVKLNKLKKVIDLMDAQEKLELFQEKVFKEHRDLILKYNGDNNFLEQGKVSVTIGKNTDRVLMLSAVYNKTIKLKADAEKMLDSLPESAKEKAMEEAEQLNFPDIITLYIYRVLKMGAESKDKEKLSKIVLSIEGELGISGTDAPTANNGLNLGINNGNLGNMANGGLAGLMSGLGPMLQGLQSQFNNANGKAPDFSGIMNTLTNSNPTIKGIVKQAFPKFEEAKSPQDMLGQVADKLGNSELKGMVEGFSTKLPELMASLSGLGTQVPTAEQTLQITGGDSSVEPTVQD